ncbi:MAG: cytochrome c oxidase assembly protein [Acidimicrobiia bacterium]|nr:cytochrome c oxidase assembly protein [Acidimicrobiia bacterium]
MIAEADPWAFQPHPEVWLLIAGIIGLGVYAVRVIGPKVVTDGPIVTRRQTVVFFLAVLLLWIAADYPMHDISEQYLYSVHMVQHLLITFMVPPLLLYATPEWLARLVILDGGSASRILRRLTHPVVAGVIFNVIAAFTHWQVFVNTSVENGAFHYGAHVVMFTAALLMWMPVLSPLREQRLSPPGQAIYLFLMSVIPTIPAAWLTFADGAVYSAYDQPFRLWGVSVASDQQAAGLIMKILGGLYLWLWIAVIFFRWASKATDDDRAYRRHRPPADAGVDVAQPALPAELTFEDVQAEFEASTPASSSSDP